VVTSPRNTAPRARHVASFTVVMPMDPHHPREESNLKDGLLGIAIAVVGLAIIMTIAHFWALG